MVARVLDKIEVLVIAVSCIRWTKVVKETTLLEVTQETYQRP
jgi:hypothetical protein